MECVFGFTGKDYVLIAGDTSAARSLVVFKTDEDRLEEIDDYNVMGTTGIFIAAI